MQRHVESCKKRRREEDVDEQVAKRVREEEVHSYNEAPNEDVPSDDTETCFEGTLQTKVWKHRGSNNTLDRQCGNCRNIIRERFISIKVGIFTIISLLFHIFFLSTFIKFFL